MNSEIVNPMSYFLGRSRRPAFQIAGGQPFDSDFSDDFFGYGQVPSQLSHIQFRKSHVSAGWKCWLVILVPRFLAE
jgi:hypothetical protein